MPLNKYELPWDSQPQEAVGVDWGHPFAKDGVCVFDGSRLQTAERQFLSPSYDTSGGPAATPFGVGKSFTGASNSVLRYDLNTTFGASDPVAIEIILYGSAFPSLASVAAITNVQLSTGIVNSNLPSDNGVVRGVMSFGGSAPCNVYAWGGNQDLDSGDAFQTQTRQHIIATRAQGTGAVQWNIYRNGALIGQANSSNASPWGTTGSSFYIGGRHYAGTVSMTATVIAAGLYRREISAAEALARFADPWQLFAPRQQWISSSVGGVLYPTLSFPTLTSIATTTARPRVTVTF